MTTTQNVGIGTTSVDAKLKINTTSNGRMLSIIGNNNDLDFFMGHTNNSYGFYWRYKGSQSGINNNMELWANNQTSADKRVYFINQSGNIYFNQNMGINTSTTGSHRLAVGGSIGAREVIVEGSGWSDFVFEESYQLPSLNEVESYIEENGHLKDVPSAETIEKEGIPLGEMDSKLLQKIEELTLYVIELNKRGEAQQEELNALKKENKKLVTQLELNSDEGSN